jgi:hypothetical protein
MRLSYEKTEKEFSDLRRGLEKPNREGDTTPQVTKLLNFMSLFVLRSRPVSRRILTRQ